MENDFEEMYFVILDHETSKVVFKKIPIPKNCPDVEDYLDRNHIAKRTECSFMCSPNPIDIVYE